MARLFFALWPPDGVREALGRLSQEVAAAAGGRRVPQANIHLTLAFLGEVATERGPLVREAADSVRGEPFELSLDRLGSFRRAGVAWMGPSATPLALGDLASNLASALRARDFSIEDRPFAAHVTLARGIGKPIVAAPAVPVAWTARQFVLVESERSTGRYAIRGTWLLGTR